MKKILQPVISLWDGAASMLSETGKQSIKRGVSALFAVTVVYLVWFVLNRDVPKEKLDTVRYLFCGLCIMITLLTGVATVKDILAFKNGPKEEPPTKPETENTPT